MKPEQRAAILEALAAAKPIHDSRGYQLGVTVTLFAGDADTLSEFLSAPSRENCR